MISRTVLPLLLLNIFIIHVHVQANRQEILVSQQFLERKRVVAQLQVTNGEGMTEDVRADALAGDPGPFAQAREQERYPILGERRARLRQEEVILTRAAPLGQFLLVWPLLVQVVQQIAQAVLTHR